MEKSASALFLSCQKSSAACVGVLGFLQYGQTFRTSLCAIEASITEETRNASMPISRNRVIAPAASLVCTVLRTRCPVNAAWTPMFAVSPSLISPTIITSGSCLRTARRPLAKVMPAFLLNCTCLTFSIRYSTGSSKVTILISGLLMIFKSE